LKIKNKIFFIAQILFLLILISGCGKKLVIKQSPLQKESISMFGKSPERNFYCNENLGDSLIQIWKERAYGSFGATSATAYGNFLFISDLSGRIFSFDIEKGKELGFVKEKGSINVSVISEQNYIYFALNKLKNHNSEIKKYNYTNGKTENKIELEGKIKSELLKIENAIIVCTDKGKIYRLDNSLKKIWEAELENPIFSSPAYSENKIIVADIKGNISSINFSDGSKNFTKKIGSGFEAGITISGNSIFAADDSGKIYSINLNDFKINWNFDTKNKINFSPALDENNLYIGNLRGNFFKLNKSNGNLEWKISTEGLLNSTPAIFNDVIVQPDLNKKLFIIDKSSGKIKRTIQYNARVKLNPLYYKGKLFIGIDDGIIYAYEKFK